MASWRGALLEASTFRSGLGASCLSVTVLGGGGGTEQDSQSGTLCPLGLHVLLQHTATHQNLGVPGTGAGTAYTMYHCNL